MAKHFKEKVENVTKLFENEEDKAMEILSNLLPEREKEFKFKKVQREDIYEKILVTKASKTTAHDSLSIDAIKEIPHTMSSIITHLVNQTIDTDEFLEESKMARIVPLRKKKSVDWLRNLIDQSRFYIPLRRSLKMC